MIFAPRGVSLPSSAFQTTGTSPLAWLSSSLLSAYSKIKYSVCCSSSLSLLQAPAVPASTSPSLLAATHRAQALPPSAHSALFPPAWAHSAKLLCEQKLTLSLSRNSSCDPTALQTQHLSETHSALNPTLLQTQHCCKPSTSQSPAPLRAPHPSPPSSLVLVTCNKESKTEMQHNHHAISE